MRVCAASRPIELETTWTDDSGKEHTKMVEGLAVDCARCGSTAEVYGRDDKTFDRGCVMLRESSPKGEQNFYMDA